jgi:hypothetical protein
MGKNTPERQEYIVNNLRVEVDMLPEDQQEGGGAKEEAKGKEALAALAPF